MENHKSIIWSVMDIFDVDICEVSFVLLEWNVRRNEKIFLLSFFLIREIF